MILRSQQSYTFYLTKAWICLVIIPITTSLPQSNPIMDNISIFPLARENPGWTKHLDREIIVYLTHTGSLSCVSKASECECLALNSGCLCCPTQQFFIPAGAGLLSIFDIEDEENINDLISQNGHILTFATPRFRLNYGRHTTPGEDTSHSYNYWKWSCCAKNIGCTGCEAVCDAEEDEDIDAAIQANEQARQQIQNASDDDGNDSFRLTPDWDDSIYGDARLGCSCGYADGLYTYCACGIGYANGNDSYNDTGSDDEGLSDDTN